MKAIYETNPTKVKELVIDMIRKSGDFDKTIKEVCAPNLSIHDTMQLYADVILAAKGTVILETVVPGAGMEELNESQDTETKNTEETPGAVAHERIGRLFSKLVEKCTAGMGADQDDDEDDEEIDDLLEGFSSEDIDNLFAKAVEQSEDCSKNIANALSAGCSLEEAYAKSFETLEKDFYKEYENIRNKQVGKKGKEYAGFIDKALNDPSIIWVDLEELGQTDVEEMLKQSVIEHPQVKKRYLFVFKGTKEYAEAYKEIVEKVSNMKEASFEDVLEETERSFADKSCLVVVIANDVFANNYDNVLANCYNIHYQFKNKFPKTVRLASAHDINQMALCGKEFPKAEQEDTQKSEEKTEKVENSKEDDFKPTPKGWMPKEGEIYYFMGQNYRYYVSKYKKSSIEEDNVKYCRVFQSKDECLLYCAIQKDLKDASREFVHNKSNYVLWYNYNNQEIEVSNHFTPQYQTLYFDSFEQIRNIVKKYGEENVIKYYFGVYK